MVRNVDMMMSEVSRTKPHRCCFHFMCTDSTLQFSSNKMFVRGFKSSFEENSVTFNFLQTKELDQWLM